MEAEAELINYGRRDSVEDELDQIKTDEEIEEALEKLKREVADEHRN